MAGSFFFFGTVAMTLFCTGIADLDSSNEYLKNVHDLMGMEKYTIDTFLDYIQDQEKRLATLKK